MNTLPLSVRVLQFFDKRQGTPAGINAALEITSEIFQEVKMDNHAMTRFFASLKILLMAFRDHKTAQFMLHHADKQCIMSKKTDEALHRYLLHNRFANREMKAALILFPSTHVALLEYLNMPEVCRLFDMKSTSTTDIQVCVADCMTAFGTIITKYPVSVKTLRKKGIPKRHMKRHQKPSS